MQARKPAIGFIFITLLLDVLGFGLLIPVAPRLVQSLLHDGAGGTEGEAAKYVGLLTAMYAVMQFVFAPLLGALSDRFGRRPVLLFSILGSGLDYIAMALAPNLLFLFITRAFNGFTGASMTVANAYIADVTAPEKRAAAYGMVGAAFGLGFILGPLMGGVLGEINIHLPFYAAGALALANWVYGLLVLPESLPKERRSHLSWSRLNPLGVFAGLARYRLVLGMACSLFLLNLAMFGLHATWVLYTAHRYGWSERDVGLSLALVGIGAAIVQAGLARKIIPMLGPGAVGEKRAVLLGVALAALAYAGYGAATQGWMIYVIIAVASLGGIAGPAAQALITKSVRPYEQGAIQGALTGLQSLANIGGPILGSTLFAYAISGRATPPLDAPGLNYFASAILAAGGLVIAAIVTRRVRPDLGPATAEHSGREPQQGEANAETNAMKSSESTKPL